MQTLLNTTVEEMEEPFVPSSSFIARSSLLPSLKPRIESLNELSTIEDRSVINPSEETFIVDNDDLSIEASRLSKGDASLHVVADDFGVVRELQNEPRTHFAIAKNDQLITMRGRSYPVTIKIDVIAASAASVIAMAGTKVLVSPVSMLMIHNPMTAAFGNSDEMQRAIEMLGSVKDSIINAYEIKTGLSRAKLSHLMDAETWMDANKAVELGFADGIMSRTDETEDMVAPTVSMLYSKANVVNSLMEKIAAKCAIAPKPTVPERTGRSVDELRAKLNTIKNYI